MPAPSLMPTGGAAQDQLVLSLIMQQIAVTVNPVGWAQGVAQPFMEAPQPCQQVDQRPPPSNFLSACKVVIGGVIESRS